MDDREQLAQRLAQLSPAKLVIVREHLKAARLAGEQAEHDAIDELVEAPLSRAQRRIWFVEQLQPGTAAFNQAMKVELHGRLDVYALQAALETIVSRHDILRRRFAHNGNEPVQIVTPLAPLALKPATLESLRRQTGRLGEEWSASELIAKWIGDIARAPFDLAAAPPLRVALLQISSREHILIFVFHHIIFDAWSIGIFARELRETYRAIASGAHHEPPPLSRQYFAYCVRERERERSNSNEMARHETFWRRQLQGAATLNVPTDRPRGSHLVHRASSEIAILPGEILAQVDRAANRHGATRFIVLAAAYIILMHRYCRQDDVVIGSSVADREEQAESVIGPFINTIVLRTGLHGNPTLAEAIACVRAVVAGALEHRALPFDRLVAELGVARDPGRHPLFKHAFVLNNTPDAALEFRDIEFTTETIQCGMTAFELFCVAQECNHELRLMMEYSTELFDPETARLLLASYLSMIVEVCGAPERRISDLTMMSEVECSRLVLELNQTSVSVREVTTVHEVFESHSARAPDAIAAQCGRSQITYRMLNGRANRLAKELVARGVGPDVAVGVLLERSIEFLVAVLAVLKAGGAFVPLDASHPPERVRSILSDSAAAVLLTKPALQERVPGVQCDLLYVDEGIFSDDRDAGGNLPGRARPGNLAYIIYTSGSTGRPKGVAVEHGSVVNLGQWQQRFFGICADCRIAQFASPSFDGAVGELVMALLNGCTLVLLDREEIEPRTLVETLRDERIDVAVFVPSLLKLLDPQWLDASRSLTMVCVGEQCPPDLASRWAPHCRFVNGYGPTECTVYSHAQIVDAGAVHRGGRVPVGLPMQNIRSYILDSQLRPVPRGAVGELHLSGDGLARCYYRQPALTADRFVPNPFAAKLIRNVREISFPSAHEAINRFIAEHSQYSPRRETGLGMATSVVQAALTQLADGQLRARSERLLSAVSADGSAHGYVRYVIEASQGSYHSMGMTAEILHHILGVSDFRGLSGVDFGFGNGEILATLASLGANVTGLDYVPHFVQSARQRGLQAELARIDAADEMFRAETGIETRSLDFVLATLVLDRVADPRQLLRNMMNSLRSQGRFAIQTLMPVVPMDDGPTEAPRIDYTQPARRICRGCDADEDCSALARLLEELGAHSIQVCKFPYAVASMDGLQVYQCWSLSGVRVQGPCKPDHGSRLYRTGDLARYREDGSVEVLGRVDQQVKIRGFRVEVEEIEAVLREHVAVTDAAVIAQADADAGTRLVACIVPSPAVADSDASTLISELRAMLSGRLPSFMTPAVFKIARHLPVATSGKLDKQKLVQLIGSMREDEPVTPAAEQMPHTPLQKVIAECWASVLGRTRVGINENIFDLGADSILIVQIAARLRTQGINFAVEQFFRQQTVAALAALLEAPPQEEQGGQSSAIEEPAGAAFSLSPIQSWFLERVGQDLAYDNQAVLLELRNPVEHHTMRQSIEYLVRRHAMLGVQFVRDAGGWRQTWRANAPAGLLERVDLGNCADPDAALAAIAARVQFSLDPEAGVMIRCVLFQQHDRMQLLVAIHHLAVDMVSWRIVLDDLSALLTKATINSEHNDAESDRSYAPWTRHLRSLSKEPALQGALKFWKLQLGRLPAMSLPSPDPNGCEADGGSVQAEISAAATDELQGLAARCEAQLEDVVLTALAAAFRDVTGKPVLFVDYEAHGRDVAPASLDISRTVGWFTALYPMVLSLDAGCSLRESVRHVSDQRRLFSKHGRDYGLLLYGSGSASDAIRALPTPRITFNHLGRIDIASDSGAFSAVNRVPAANRAGHKQRFSELEVISFVRERRLHLEFRHSVHPAFPVSQLLARVGEIFGELPDGKTAVASFVRNATERETRALKITAAQHAMLMHSLAAPRSGVYVNQVYCRIDGELQLQRLLEAWRTVVARHPTLRAGFAWAGVCEPLQIISTTDRFECQRLDWRDHDDDKQQQMLTAWLGADRSRAFDLQAPPLMRLCVIDTADTCHLLIWTFHHLLVDGWSVGVILKEVLQAYDAHNEVPQREQATCGMYWRQVDWSIKQSLEDQAEFWRSQLAGASAGRPVCIAPKAEPVIDRFEGLPGEEVVTLQQREHEQLTAFAHRHRLTMNTLVLAAWAATLCRYSGSSTALFGCVLSGRSPQMPQMESAVGMFINTVPLLLSMRFESTVLDWLQDVQRRQLDVQAAQHSPIASILSWANLRRAEQPFDSIVLFENYPLDGVVERYRGPIAVGVPVVIQQSNYPLMLVALPRHGLQLRIAYQRARFDAHDIDGMLGQMRLTLAAFVARPNARLASLPPCTASELKRVGAFNEQQQYAVPEGCIQDLFREQCRLTPTALAVKCGSQTLTYAELDRRSNQLANYLLELGVGPDRVVGLCVQRSLDLYVGLLGIFKAGGAYLPLDPKLPRQRIATLIERSDAMFVLAQKETARAVAGATVLVLDDCPPKFAAYNDTLPAHSAVPDNLAYVMFTSGSTGVPKGVLGTHRAALNCFRWLWLAHPFAAGEICCQKTSIAFGDSVEEIFGPLLAGVPSVIIPDAVLLDPIRFMDLLGAHEVTRIVLVPSLLRAIVEAVEDLPAHVPKLVHWLVSGEALSTELAEAFVKRMPQARLINLYGASEVACDVTACTVKQPIESRPFAPIGKPVANLKVHVLDEHLLPVASRVIGGIYVGGAGLARGYLASPALTAAAFLPDPFAPRPGERFYCTGDLGYIDEQGQLVFTGRSDQQIKLRGFRVELEEITSALESHPSVSLAFTTVILGRHGECKLASAVMPKRTTMLCSSQGPSSTGSARNAVAPATHAPCDIAALRGHLRDLVPDYMVPSGILIVEEFPRTASGKIDRVSLARQLSDAGSAGTGAVVPLTSDLQRLVAEVWSRVVGVSNVSGDDNFFDIGGHSLLMIRVCDEVSRRMNRVVSVIDLYRYPTVRDLAAFLEGTAASNDALAVERGRRRATSSRTRRADPGSLA